LGHVRADHLDLRDLAHGGKHAFGVDQPGGFQDEQASLFDGDAGVGDAFAVAAEVDQRLAEGDAFGAAFAGQAQRQFGEADQAHAVVDVARAKATMGDLEDATGARDDGGLGQAHVVELDFAVAVGFVVHAHGLEHAHGFYAGGIFRHEHHRVLGVAVGVGVGETHEDDDFAVRVADAGAPPFAAVEHDFVALDFGGGFHVGGVGGRHARFGHAEGGADLAGEQWGEPLLFLFFAAVVVEHFHVAGVGRVAVEDFRGDGGLAGDFGNGGVVGNGQAGAEFFVRQEHVPEALFAGFRLQLLDDRQYHPAVVEAVQFAVVGHFARDDLVLHEALDAGQVVLGLGRRGKVHG